MSYERKFEKADLSVTETNISAETQAEAWDKAIERVTMNVAVLPAQINQPNVDDEREVSTENELMSADYLTDNGRNGTFYMIMVDRHNNNEWRALSPCTDYYAAIKPELIYNQLRSLLDHVDCEPVYVYNSLSGGKQQMVIEVNGMEGVTDAEGMKMELLLTTSLDRSSNHCLSVRPVTDSGVPIYFADSGKSGFNFKVKHTKGAKAEIESFNQASATIISNWNNQIVPFVKFLSDGVMNEQDVGAMLTNIVEDADLPEKAVNEIEMAYKQDWVDMGTMGSNAMKAIGSICQWNEDKEQSPMARQRNADKIGKAINKRVGQLFRKYAE